MDTNNSYRPIYSSRVTTLGTWKNEGRPLENGAAAILRQVIRLATRSRGPRMIYASQGAHESYLSLSLSLRSIYPSHTMRYRFWPLGKMTVQHTVERSGSPAPSHVDRDPIALIRTTHPAMTVPAWIRNRCTIRLFFVASRYGSGHLAKNDRSHR
jgi:hypothetical protein